MKNLLIQRKTEEENQMTGGNMPLIDKEHNGNVLLLDGKHSGDMLLRDRKLVKLEDNAKYVFLPKFTKLENNAEYRSLPKLTKLVKKPFNLTRTGKEKPHCLISYFLACFIEPIG